jgi:hypothetical protein
LLESVHAYRQDSETALLLRIKYPSWECIN